MHLTIFTRVIQYFSHERLIDEGKKTTKSNNVSPDLMWKINENYKHIFFIILIQNKIQLVIIIFKWNKNDLDTIKYREKFIKYFNFNCSSNQGAIDNDFTATPLRSYRSNLDQRGDANGSVVNRLGREADRWKRQVEIQRHSVYDRHTMLN